MKMSRRLKRLFGGVALPTLKACSAEANEARSVKISSGLTPVDIGLI